jgi:glycerol dehydrogenase-like iron-containing ADH family enzyme
MTAAGFGDILAKLIAILDWRLAWRLKMRIIAL